MFSLVILASVLASAVPLEGTMVYGRCPLVKPIYYKPDLIKPFEGNNGNILYFSNVRFEAMFNRQRYETEERYVSDYAIVLEHKEEEQCFLPFQLRARGRQMENDESGSLTMINATILAMHEQDYLFAFSCVQLGHNKLEYVWIFGRAGRFGIGKEKVRKMFGHLLANMSTELKDLRRSHHELPFCTSILWSAVAFGVCGVLVLLVLTVGIVCWKKHKQIMQLRRQSCAECEYPVQEFEMVERERRDITSAKTIAIMHGAII